MRVMILIDNHAESSKSSVHSSCWILHGLRCYAVILSDLVIPRSMDYMLLATEESSECCYITRIKYHSDDKYVPSVSPSIPSGSGISICNNIRAKPSGPNLLLMLLLLYAGLSELSMK